MPELPTFGRFFLPGPTEVLPEVLQAQVGPMMGHRAKGMEELIASIQPGLQSIFRTERPVYIAASSATGLMEAAVRNGARRRVLALVNGAFSERFQTIVGATGLEADAVDVGWGGVHTADRVADALKRGDYDAVTVVHCETSTGVLNPIGEIAAAAHAAGDVTVLVDTVSSLAGAPVETDAWGLDFVLTGSQKCFALPPGLAFGVAQESLLERAAAKADRGLYFDLLAFEKNIRKNQTPNTPAVSLIYALAAQLERIGRETPEGRWARHEAMARRTWAWVDEMRDRGVDLAILAPEGYRSPTVTCITLPEDWTGPRLCAAMKERGGFTIAPGYGKMKERMFRIGHMGDHTVDELEALLAALEEVLVR
ncbi:MAG TPA: alanine--glyoxylate aminotransferase family protein [Longimicrobiales bacterium]